MLRNELRTVSDRNWICIVKTSCLVDCRKIVRYQRGRSVKLCIPKCVWEHAKARSLRQCTIISHAVWPVTVNFSKCSTRYYILEAILMFELGRRTSGSTVPAILETVMISLTTYCNALTYIIHTYTYFCDMNLYRTVDPGRVRPP